MVYIIVGKTCSGKTFLCNFIEKQSMKKKVVHIEASSIVKQLKLKPSQLIISKCKKISIARYITKKVEDNKDCCILISGLRSIEELDFIIAHLKCKYNIIVLKASYIKKIKRYCLRSGQVKFKLVKYCKKCIIDNLLGINKLIRNVYNNEYTIIIDTDLASNVDDILCFIKNN